MRSTPKETQSTKTHICITKNCLMCDLYEHPNLYTHTYNFEAKEKEPLNLDENGYCFLKNDLGLDGKIIPEFSRTDERDCCSLGIIQTALIDKELQSAKDIYELKEMFEKKYLTNETM